MTGHTNSCGVITISKVKRGGESTRCYVTLLFKYNYNVQYCLCTYAEFCMNNNYNEYKTSENFDAFTRFCGWSNQQMSAKAVSKAFVFAGGEPRSSHQTTRAVVNKIDIKKVKRP